MFFSQEKSQLQKKLQESEQRLRLLELTDTADATVAKRYKKDVHINKHQYDKTIPTQGPLSSFCSELLTESHSLHQRLEFSVELDLRVEALEKHIRAH